MKQSGRPAAAVPQAVRRRCRGPCGGPSVACQGPPLP